MSKISVLIPVHRESPLLEGLLTDLIGDPYQSKEVLVIVDKPTEMSRKAMEKFGDKAAFILNGERVGKVNALNEAFKRTTGNILLFLDSDIQLQADGASFLGVLEKEMEDTEILDIKKSTTRVSFLTKLVHYEYLSSSLVSYFFSKRVGKSLGLNGAAFAIRREAFERLSGFRRTVTDDFDLITRSFLESLSFKYTHRVSVVVKPQSGWKEWYRQRRRWGIATGVWLKDYYKPLAKTFVRKPQAMLPSLLLLMPSLLLILSFLLPNAIFYAVPILASSVLHTYFSLVLLPISLNTFSISIASSFTVTAITYAVLSVIYYSGARELGYYFNPAEFLCYYLIYSPLSLLLTIIGIFRVVTHKDVIDLDWKV